MTDKDIDRAAAMVRATPIRTNRTYVPPSRRYGERWSRLPVDGAVGQPRTREAAPRGLNRLAWAERFGDWCVGAALAGALYLFVRFGASFL